MSIWVCGDGGIVSASASLVAPVSDWNVLEMTRLGILE